MAERADTGAPSVIGIAGAGTMGAGIAQLACLAGARTMVHDPDPEALERGLGRISHQLERGATRGRWTPEQAEQARELLEPAAALGDLAPCELVIEAAPERLDIKRSLFERLGAVVSGDCVLATNTSSMLVTALADAAPDPSRVVGMHFFNPPPVMRLLEVVAGSESSPRAIAVARAAGEAMGKHVIEAVDGPGFIVNRCNRPFGLEALRLLQERVATIDEIDRACRLGGGFRMGPFELMDLVGVDVGLDVSRSFYEQSFGEPRWRPSPITVKTVAAGRLGRKSGRGYYEYPASGEHRPPDLEPPPVGGGDGLVVIAGETPLAALDPGGSAVGFHALPPLHSTRLVELTRGPDTADSAAEAAEHFFATLGKHTMWVDDAPGLVLGRIVCQVANEAAFALGEGLASAQDIDAGMIHGLSYPRGILAWADEIGLDHVLSVLDALALERGEDRYRAAPRLRRLGWSGRLGRQTGAGFFEYDDAS